MATGTPESKRLIAERVRALAIMHLTRSRELVVESAGADMGFDLSVRISRDDREGLRQFGVELRGAWHAIAKAHAEKALGPTMQQLMRYAPFPFPVCVFFFTMENDQGWFSWVAQPLVDLNGRPSLQLLKRASCKQLDNGTLNEIVDEVNQWYDAFYDNLIARNPKA